MEIRIAIFEPRSRITLAIILAIISLVVTVKRFDQFASRYDDFDFNHFYGWGSRYRSGEDAWTKLEEGKTPSGVPRVCNQTPALLAAIAPLTLLNPRPAHAVWIIAQIVFLVLALWLLMREIGPPLDVASGAMFIALALMFGSVRRIMLNAAFPPMLLLSLVISWKCARSNRPAVGGLFLAIAALLKLYPIALAGYYLLRKRWSLLGWTAGFFAVGVVATGIENWLQLPLSREYTISEITRVSANHVALLPSVYALCARVASDGARRWIAAIAVTVILDIVITVVLVWATLAKANDSISDGLVFGLWLIAMVLVSPLSWRGELVLLFPAYIFASVAGLRVSMEGRAFLSIQVVTALVFVGVCAAVELIKALPDFRPQTLTAILIFIATTMMLSTWLDRQVSR